MRHQLCTVPSKGISGFVLNRVLAAINAGLDYIQA